MTNIGVEINKRENRKTRENQQNQKLIIWKEQQNEQILAWLTKKKTNKKREREGSPPTAMRRRELTADLAEVTRITRGYCEQLCANELDNGEETENFLERHELLKLTQEEIENLNRHKTKLN